VPGDVFASYGRYWGEFLALAARPARLDRLPLRIEGEAFLTTAAARGPVCCLTGHLGNWDLAARLIARRLPGFAVMAEELEPRALFHAFTAIREEAGCRVIAADRGGLRLYRHLREGGHAGLVIDRVIGTGTRRAAFAGGMREFPAAGLDLARRAGAALVPVFLVRERGEFLLRIHPPLPESGDPVDAFARILESEVAAFAAQWCLLYPLHASMDDAEFPRGGAVEGKVVTA
jgi:KDO2-lipid IV(A) lauroyltransferase